METVLYTGKKTDIYLLIDYKTNHVEILNSV